MRNPLRRPPAALDPLLVGLLAGRGVLVVRPDALEDLVAATHVLFDKTGTLTEPSIMRSHAVALRDIGLDTALAIAAALAQGSHHSLARAFTAAAPKDLPPVDSRESVAGFGIGGVIGGRRYRLGRSDYALARDAQPSGFDDAVILADDDGAVAAFHVDERLQPGVRAAVDALARDGLVVAIASGDATVKVASVAAALGIRTWSARQTPADKLAWLASLRATGARVVVVGDGVNDAPMLAGADVAVAVSSAADVAQATSDIVITGTLDALADARTIAGQMLSILRQNRRWALGYNLAAIPLAAFGLVPPWLAAIAMSASSLAVVLNALRIGRATRLDGGDERLGAVPETPLHPSAST